VRKGVEQHLVLVKKDLFLLVIFSAILLTMIDILKNKGASCIGYEHLSSLDRTYPLSPKDQATRVLISLAWAFEYIHQCQQSKQEIVLIKLDFTKAFDTIEHNSIAEIMKQLGFSKQWLAWISAILSSATTSILLNGVPKKNLQCRREVM
jgi:hypothetical protein